MIDRELFVALASAELERLQTHLDRLESRELSSPSRRRAGNIRVLVSQIGRVADALEELEKTE